MGLSIDRENVIKELEERIKVAEECMGNPMFTPDAIRTIVALLKEQQQQIWELEDQVEYLTDKQKERKFLVDSDGKITPLPDVVRCKDCIHRGNAEKCVLAAISEEKNFPLFMLDNRGEWFCADGKQK